MLYAIQGAIDYVLNYGLSQRGWMVIPIGLVYGIVYYGLFRSFIRKFNMATPGREPATTDAETDVTCAVDGDLIPPLPGAASAGNTRASKYISALGGASNLTLVDACTTRLRLSVVDAEKVSEPQLKSIGARGGLKRGATNVQVIIGPEADLIADEIRGELEHSFERGATPASSAPAHAAAAVSASSADQSTGQLDPDPLRWLAVFGGATNVASLDAVAQTRLRVVVRDPSSVDRQRLSSLDVAWVSADTIHIVGDRPRRAMRRKWRRVCRRAAAQHRCRPDRPVVEIRKRRLPAPFLFSTAIVSESSAQRKSPRPFSSGLWRHANATSHVTNNRAARRAFSSLRWLRSGESARPIRRIRRRARAASCCPIRRPALPASAP